jgi:hypothetical protein
MLPSNAQTSIAQGAWRALAITALAALFIVTPMQNLLDVGPYLRLIQQPPALQGGAEVLALTFLIGAILLWISSPRWRFLALVSVSELYLRRHYVDLPLIVDLLYLELIVGLGATANRLFGRASAANSGDYLRCFVAGFVIWSLCAWGLSALGFGSSAALRWLTVCLAIPACMSRQVPLSVFAYLRMSALEAFARAGAGVMLAWFLSLLARSNVVASYDALWYGLRGESVLVGAGSVYRSMGLVAPVHYYPKLFELFLVPVSGLGDASVIVGVNIAMLALLLLCAYRMLDRFGLSQGQRVLCILACATLPALANSALEPKPDMLAALLLLLGCRSAAAFAQHGRRSQALWTALLGALACCTKLNVLPYVALLWTATPVVWAWRRFPRAADDRRDLLCAYWLLAGSAVLIVAATLRTYVLAGVPLVAPDALVSIALKLGFQLKAPASILVVRHTALGDMPSVVFDALFQPSGLPLIVITWPGNIWLFLGLVALLAGYRRRIGEPAPMRSPVWYPLMVLGPPIILAHSSNGGDGNYYIVPLVLAMLLGFAAAAGRLANSRAAIQTLYCSVCLFIAFHASYAFVSAGGSAPGTREFDFDLTRNVRDSRERRQQWFEMAGMVRVGDYLRRMPGVPRSTGYALEPAALWLPGSFEHLVVSSYWRPEYLASESAFLAHLLDCRIDYLILPHAGVGGDRDRVPDAVARAAQLLRAHPQTQVIEDRDYTLLDLSAVHAESTTP